MKIAVTYDNGIIFQHFGHTEKFKLYDVENNKVISETVVDTKGQGHGVLAGLLADENVEILICGGIGAGAQKALEEAGIKLYGGVSGKADDSVKAFIMGRLVYNPDIKCNHHDHEHADGHKCGEHSHEGHTCH